MERNQHAGPSHGRNGEGIQPSESPEAPDLTAAQRAEARQKYEEAKEARKKFTTEDIQKLGIYPKDEDLVPDSEAGTARKKTRIDDRDSIRKVYCKQGISSACREDSNTDMEADDVVEHHGEIKLTKPRISDRLQEIHDTYVKGQHRAIAEFETLVMSMLGPETEVLVPEFDLLASICTSADVTVAVCKHLYPVDIINLYSLSKDFHDVLNTFMRSCILALANHMAPAAARICRPQVYPHLYIDDPLGRPQDPAYHDLKHLWLGTAPKPVTDTTTRKVPGLRWLTMVHHRERCCRDIVATMARMGHRLAKDSREMLLKLWLMMDIATNEGRVRIVRSRRLFTDQDIYNAHLFFIKLLLLFNNPVHGPESPRLMHLFLGQRSLRPLWSLLRRKAFQTEHEIIFAGLWYDIQPTQQQIDVRRALRGIHIDQVGTGHLEGWGQGLVHLLRPDEVLPIEAVRRNMPIQDHLDFFLHFGHVDLMTGRNLVPSLEEMYMSDDEYDWPDPDFDKSIDGGCGNVPFELDMWQPRHARKARWGTLTTEEKKEILRLEMAEVEAERRMTNPPESSSEEEEEPDVDIEKLNYENRLQEFKIGRAARLVHEQKVDKGKGKAIAEAGDDNTQGDAMDIDKEDDDIPDLSGFGESYYVPRSPIPMAPTLQRLQSRNFSTPTGRPSSQTVNFEAAGLATSGPAVPPAELLGKAVAEPTTGLHMLQEAADSLRDRKDAGSGSEISSDRESEKGWRDEDAEMEALDDNQLTKLKDEAGQEYNQQDLEYPWEVLVRSFKLLEKMPLTEHELKTLGWRSNLAVQGSGEGAGGHGVDSEYVPDENEKDPRLANRTQVVLQKAGEEEGEEVMSDVEINGDDEVVHLDDDGEDEGWNNEYDGDDYRWDAEIGGKHGALRNYYRRY
ncbi:hypothetical protein GQ53DRAFT_871309 [Thozetella sp. PMI_491]|nr:hypothetical protein GQ53DRAFT_871309 [Thozetella sp. PMI_491]